MSDQTDDQFSDEEAAQRRDAVVKRMLGTPPQPRTQQSRRAPKGRPDVAGPLRYFVPPPLPPLDNE